VQDEYTIQCLLYKVTITG